MENSYWRVLILSGAWMLGTGVQAQSGGVQYVNEMMTQEDAASENWEETYERLSELEQQPLDINTASREQLEELPFLSDQQIEELQEYLYRYGPMKSAGELLMIRSLGFEQRRLLSQFIYFGVEKEKGFPTWREVAKYGRNELMGTASIPFYRRRGDQNQYLGSPYRHWLRYQYAYGESFKIGLVGAQDAGEPFFAHQNKWGYDYYSFYLQMRNLGRIESLCLGHYRVSMGMGLVMNSEFTMGKLAVLQNMSRATQVLRAHSSRSNNSLLGGAATVSLGHGLKLTGFASYRPMDATLNKDSTISTILSTSYHRTETEIAKKHNIHALKTGGMIGFRQHGFHAGLNMLYVRLDKELRPNASILYRQHYPQGRAFFNTSLDYGYVNHRWALNGETALDKDGHLATLNSVSLLVNDVLSLVAIQRFYSYCYTSLDAQSYSDGGRVQNESGVYIGLSWQPSARWRVSAYTDYAYFPWAKYQVSQSSSSWDYLLQTTYQHRAWTFAARYRLRIKETDGADGTSLQRQPVHRMRLSADYADTNGFGCRTQVDGGYGDYGDREWGAMVSESLAYTYRWLRLNAGLGYFHTDGYESRVYLHELGPLYTYSMTAFYGEGIRYWLMMRAGIGRHLSLTAKVGVTNYFDRETIGSGYQQVDASSLTNLDLQFRWVF